MGFYMRYIRVVAQITWLRRNSRARTFFNILFIMKLPINIHILESSYEEEIPILAFALSGYTYRYAHMDSYSCHFERSYSSTGMYIYHTQLCKCFPLH